MTKIFISFLLPSYHRPTGSQGLFRVFPPQNKRFFPRATLRASSRLRRRISRLKKLHKIFVYLLNIRILVRYLHKKMRKYNFPKSCYRFVTLCSDFHILPVSFCRSASKVGNIALSSPGKLDKSGSQVYTSPSFSIGNKSYKLFSLKKTTQGPPFFSGGWPCRSFSGGTL